MYKLILKGDILDAIRFELYTEGKTGVFREQ